MLTQIRHLLTPPVFDDPEKNRVAGILYMVLVVTLAIIIVATIASVAVNYFNQQIFAVTLPAIAGILLLSSLVWLARRGQIQAAGIGLVVVILLIITGTILDSGGIQNISAGSFVVAVVIAGIVLGTRGALATAVASTAIVLGIAYAQSVGLLVISPPSSNPIVVYSAVFIVTGLLMYQAAQNYSVTLEQVRQTNQELRALSGVLEERVSERTRDLALAVEIGRQVSRIRDLDQLLLEAVEQIRSRFDLYYAQIYLTDSSGQGLALRAGTGIVGEQLVQAGHRLPLAPTSINGMAATEKRAVLVTDTSKSPAFRPNALLPDTRSEASVPLIAGNNVVGVINLQGDQAGILSEENLPAFEALAGQLATAIENANLITELRKAQAEVEAHTRRLLREGWGDFLDGIQRSQLLGYRYDGQTQQVEVLAELEETATSTSSVQAVARQFATPIVLGGEELGQIHLQFDQQEAEQDESGRSLVEAVAHQVAQQVENLRLLAEAARYRSEAEEAVRRLTRESWINFENVKPDVIYEYDRKQVIQKPVEEVVPDMADIANNGRYLLEQPLLIHGEAIGSLEVALTQAEDEETAVLVTAVANQLSSHLENLRLSQTSETSLSEAQQRSQELAQINQIVTTVAGSLDLQQSLQIIADGLADILNVDQVAIALLNEANDSLQIVADHFDQERSQSAIGISLPLAGNDLTLEVLGTHQSIEIEDAQNHPRTALIHDALRSRGVETLYLFPIVTGNKAIGTVGIDILEKEHSLTSNQLRLAETVIFQAATAIQNSQLFEQLEGLLESAEKQAQRLAILNDLGDQFNRSQSTEEVYQLVIEHAGQLFDYDRITLLQFDSEVEQATVLAVEDNITQELQAGMVVPLSAAIAERVIKQRSVLRILDDKEQEDGTVASSLIAPLLTGRGVLGTINVSSKAPNAYSSQDENNLLQLANYIASTLENQRLFATVEARAQELEVLNEVARSLSYQLEPQQLMETVFNQVRRILPADVFFVAVYDPESDMVAYPYIYDDGEFSSEEIQPLNPASRVHAVIRSGEPVLNHLTAEEIEDIKQNQSAVLLGENTGKVPASLLYVPLKSGNQIKGVLSIQAYASDLYTETDVTLLSGVASYAAVALENARLFEAAQRRAHRERLVNEITQKIQSERTVEDTLQTAVQELGQALQAKYTQVEILAHETGTQSSADTDTTETDPSLLEQTAEMRYAYDLQQLIVPENGRSASPSTEPALTHPLIIQGSEIGQLWLNEPQTLAEEAGDIASAVAERLALHIENLRLSNQTEMALSETETLYQATARLNTAQTYDQVLDVLRQYTVAGRQAHLVSLNLFDRAWTAQQVPDWINAIAYWSSRPAKREIMAYRLAEYPSASTVLQADRPTIITDAHTDERIDDNTRALFVRAFQATSVLFVPLVTGGQWRGYINAFYDQKMTFSEAEIRRLTLLASQAAVAIQSLQLLRQTEQQLANLTNIQQTTSSLSAAISFDEAINSFMQQVCRAVKADSVDMYRLDGNVVNRIGVYPTRPDEPVAFSCTLEQQTMMRRAVETRAPAVLAINDSTLDDDLRHSFAEAGIGANVTLPLIGRKGIFGILSVNREQAEQQFDEQALNLLQTLSDQAMIAFERVQLLEEATRQAEHEQRLREVTTRVRSSIDVDAIMRTAVQEVGRVLGRRTFIYLDHDAQNGNEQPEEEAQVAY
jgi:phosphoserine phosphatase RsbU/P